MEMSASSSSQSQLHELLAEALSLGVSRAELVQQVPALSAALQARSVQARTGCLRRRLRACFRAAAYCVLLFLGACAVGGAAAGLGAEWPEEVVEAVAERYVRFTGGQPFVDRCVVYVDEWPLLLDLLRPVASCERCSSLVEVPRVVDLQPIDFEAQFAYSSVPVVVTDAMTDWPAKELFDFNFLSDLYNRSTESSLLTDGNCQFFRYKSDFRSLSEVFRMPPARRDLLNNSKPWYVGWNTCDPLMANRLREFYSRPYFLPQSAESAKTDWIFMGYPGHGAHMHVDNVRHPSWQAQIRGVKTWTLLPPLECRYQCAAHRVTVQPGDVIVLDTNWWYHSTWIEPGQMSLTIGSEYD